MKVQQLDKLQQDKLSELFKKCGLFFAFSNQQFEEQKKELEPGDEYINAGSGAILPKSKVKEYIDGMKEINRWYKAAIKDGGAGLRREKILYELNNHEAFYVYDIEDTMMALGEGYSHEEVWKVFHENYEAAMANQ